MNKQIISVKTVALISYWCAQFGTSKSLNLAFKCLWKFYWNTISGPACDSEVRFEFLYSFFLLFPIHELVRIYLLFKILPF